MERVLFISRAENLKYAGQEYGRIYFGNEFCEKLIPAVAEVEKVRDYCKKNKTGFSLVTPYVTDAGMAKLDKLFSFLLGNGESCEVIVNDYGVLSLINEEYPVLRPVLGRLLTKQKRDVEGHREGHDGLGEDLLHARRQRRLPRPDARHVLVPAAPAGGRAGRVHHPVHAGLQAVRARHVDP